MLQKLLLAGVFVGSLASIPVLYEQEPERFLRWLRASAPEQAKPAVAKVELAEKPSSGRKVRLSPDARGHFVGDFKLNGRAVLAMVDTGATLVAINRSTAKRIGIALTNKDFSRTVSTANGQIQAAPATIERMQIGRITVYNVPAVVLQDTSLAETLIGMSFLKQIDQYRVESGELVLED